MQDLDSNKPEAFELLYQFKREDIDSEIGMAKHQANVYKSGKNDPAHIVGFERMQKQNARKRKPGVIWKSTTITETPKQSLFVCKINPSFE